jgi:hypothetical protein
MWIFCGIFTVIGSLVLHPVYVAVCEPNQYGASQKCELHDVLYVAFSKIGGAVTRAEFWTALATIFIAIFTFTLKRSTDNLWTITKITAEHIPRIERAYIYGGFGGRLAVPDGQGGFNIATAVSMANYGKTPGFIRFIEYGSCHLNDLPVRPEYQRSTPISDLYFPEMTMKEVRLTNATLLIPGDGSHAVFQRVHYRDVLGKNHYSGSVYQLFIVRNGTEVSVGDRPLRPEES